MKSVIHTGRRLKTSKSGNKKYMLSDEKTQKIKDRIYKKSLVPYINDIAKESTNYMKSIVYNDWYSEYTPRKYKRTMDMYNSIVYKEATYRKNGSVGTTIGWDKRLIRVYGNHHTMGRDEIIDIIESSGMSFLYRGEIINRNPTHARKQTKQFVEERFDAIKAKEKIIEDFSGGSMRIYMNKSQIKNIK